jgi:hypothetical protein
MGYNSNVLLEKLMVSVLVKNFASFMEAAFSSRYSKRATNGRYPYPNKASPYIRKLMYLNIILLPRFPKPSHPFRIFALSFSALFISPICASMIKSPQKSFGSFEVLK